MLNFLKNTFGRTKVIRKNMEQECKLVLFEIMKLKNLYNQFNSQFEGVDDNIHFLVINIS